MTICYLNLGLIMLYLNKGNHSSLTIKFVNHPKKEGCLFGNKQRFSPTRDSFTCICIHIVMITNPNLYFIFEIGGHFYILNSFSHSILDR